MWIKSGKGLVQTTDTSREGFATNISRTIIKELKVLSKEHETQVNYLIENGLEALLEQNYISFDKKFRPKDRSQFNTIYDKELLENVRNFAKKHNLYMNDVIEYSTQLINPDEAKGTNHRYRIE